MNRDLTDSCNNQKSKYLLTESHDLAHATAIFLFEIPVYGTKPKHKQHTLYYLQQIRKV